MDVDIPQKDDQCLRDTNFVYGRVYSMTDGSDVHRHVHHGVVILSSER